jgi:integrase
MAIRKFFSNKAKAGWRWDAGKEKFWSWGYDIRLENGKRKRESGFATRSLAENAVARIRIGEKEGKYNLQPQKFPTLKEVLEKRLFRYDDQKERKRAETVFSRWLEMLPASLKLNELATAHLRLYISERLQQVKAVSVNREMNCIASALHSAFLDFPELENWNAPRIPRPKVERSRRERLISGAEIMRLLSGFAESRRETETAHEFERRRVVGQVFQMCLLTGARPGEIIRLRWEQIDFKAKLLQIVGTKTRFKQAKAVRYLEITPTIEQILLERKEKDAFGEFVFSRTGNSVTHYYEILQAESERAGVIYGKNKAGGFVTYDARHTATTRMLQAGVDLSTVGAITGHSDANLVLHYSHATRESRKKAVSVLEEFVANSAHAKTKKAS